MLDLAEETGGDLAAATAGDAGPHEVAGALLRELGRRAPTILVIEDLHWADEATLDVVRLLARKADTAPARRALPLRLPRRRLRRGDRRPCASCP